MDKVLEIVNGEVVIKSDILQELNNCREAKAVLEKRYKEITEQILKESAEDYGNGITRFSGYNLVAKGGTYTLEFDLERLKQEQPLVYADYCKVKKSEETFSLVYRKKGE